MTKGNINVTVENIFPLIKKFLYSDHEIFLRELVSNATDATLKLKHLASIGEYKGNLDDVTIEVKIDDKNKTLHIIDKGLGMTGDEVKKYINEVAFSGAEEFIDKYKDKNNDTGIIGHFGLGFYSAFMVADKVDIITKSYKDEPAVKWTCDGSPKFTLVDSDKKDRGTEIVLHIAEDSKGFLEKSKIEGLLVKYNKFMPIPIKFGTKEETKIIGEGKDAKEEKIVVDNIINNPTPAWTKKPADLKDEDYNNFYRELYPMQFEEPLFHIHLNVDYPFHLTGILYFPKLKNQIDIQKEKIQLYQNQVFVTDNVEGIVPDFLQMLRGVIDSPDIPLNVSRSYLQADAAVKKIAGYITKKVADKLNSLYKNNREDFEKKWDDIKVIIEYGMLSEPKFYEKATKFALYPTVDKTYFTLDEFKDKVKDIEKVKFSRVDADSIDNLIKKDDTRISKLSDDEKEKLKTIITEIVPKETYTVQLESLDSNANPFIITVPEFMRRMKEMSATGGGGMMGMGNFPEMYNLVVNTNNDLMQKILKAKKNKEEYVKQALDLAKLSQNLLQGEELTNFVKRSFELMK